VLRQVSMLMPELHLTVKDIVADTILLRGVAATACLLLRHLGAPLFGLPFDALVVTLLGTAWVAAVAGSA
jgi:hypothetical protein